MRRIRLQSSFARLPSFRVWFLVPQSAVDVQSLKIAICTQLPSLRDIPPRQLILEIDDFELLDECAIDLVRDGDTLTIKTRETVVLDTLKRKAKIEEAAGAPKRRRFIISSEDSHSASSCYTSDSSSSDSSSNSSSLSSSSDSNTEDSKLLPHHKVLSQSNDTIPKSKSIPPPSRGQAAIGTVTGDATQKPTVPPGMGKASTRSRNKRRKLKRRYGAVQSSTETLQSTRLNEPSSSGSGVVLEPSRQFSEQRPNPATVSIIPHSSVDKISRSKGFTNAAESPIPQKTVFDSSSAVVPSGCNSTFIPPSKRDDLPKNLFVTAVEIAWRTNQPRTYRDDTSEQVQPDDNQAVQADSRLRHFNAWATIERAWDKYTTLNASVELLPGATIAWKAFGLDPVTLTPQASMLYLGKIVSVDVENVHVQPLQRPDSEHATFGRASMGEDQEPSEQISRPLHDVWSNDWKLIPSIT